tara:strand:+ start:52 stop:483 length:432 start_codon:yes stop_codon:yes gene_type:complete
MKYFIIILALVITLILNGCAKDATAEDSTVATPVETSTETRTNAASGEVIWIAIVTIWNPINRTIDKEFTSEVNCWNYYEEDVGESKFGTQHLDHQGNKPDKDYMNKNRPPHREYPNRMYRGITDEQGQVWLTCDIKGKYQGL